MLLTEPVKVLILDSSVPIFTSVSKQISVTIYLIIA